jgi:hypothetical protein
MSPLRRMPISAGDRGDNQGTGIRGVITTLLKRQARAALKAGDVEDGKPLWVGGTGNWSDTNHWSESSGEALEHLSRPLLTMCI